MNNEAVNVGSTATKLKGIKASDFQEYSNIEVTGNFRGSWRDVAVTDEEGNPVIKDGQPVIRHQFKIGRSVKLGDKVVRQAAWLTEADAKAHNLIEGVKYNLTLSVGEELMPSKSNGREGYLDEYAFADATIVSVNSK